MRPENAALFFNCFAWFALPLLTGCPTEPPPRAREPVVIEDEWSKTAQSQEWLHATADSSGDHAAECAHVLAWVKGEESCKASLCEHGRVLAGEWLNRCSKLAEASAVTEVKSQRDKLTERAAQKATPCGATFDEVLVSGCGEDKTCEATGQRWATRCAKSEGSPFLVRILERVIERKLPDPAPVKLDTRSCDDLRVDVMEAGKCKDRFVCGEAIPRVEAYRSRCETDGDRPTIATAVAELAVILGADRSSAPILVQPGHAKVEPDEAPVVLADGSGSVLLMCDERASDLPRYLAARKGCQGGRIVVARVFKGERGMEVRAGTLEFPDEAAFSVRYPTIVTAKELELRDRAELGGFLAELTKATEVAKLANGGLAASKLLAKAVNDHAAGILRSEAMRAALTAHDQALVPALTELGKAKAGATKGRVSAPDADGLLVRAATRAFADVTADGAVQIGASSKASRLNTAALLPQGTAGLLGALKQARPRKLDKNAVQAAKAAGAAAAASCGESEKKLLGAQQALLNCGFGVDRCDAGMVDALSKSLETARSVAEGAYHALDLARTGGAAEEAGALGKAAAEAGCKEPWW